MNRLPQVFVFHVGADVVVKEKIDYLDVAVGSSNVQLKKITINPTAIDGCKKKVVTGVAP